MREAYSLEAADIDALINGLPDSHNRRVAAMEIRNAERASQPERERIRKLCHSLTGHNDATWPPTAFLDHMLEIERTRGAEAMGREIRRVLAGVGGLQEPETTQ